MAKDKRIVLQPKYMAEFHCIGSKCEDSCCVGWRVDIDKETYQKYKEVNDIELKPIFEKHVNRKHNQKNNTSYAKINMDKEQKCPFLDENMLCKIQMNLGESYLSKTCALYPRGVKQVDGKLERSATMSCPEIVRLALFCPEGIIFEQVEEDIHDRIKIGEILDTEGHLYLNKPQRYFWDIRLFSIGLLQNREYSLADRLILLGISYKKIEKLHEEGRCADIPALLETLSEMVDSGSFKSELDNVPVNIELQLKLAKEMADKRFVDGFSNKRYMNCVIESLMGIGYKDGELLENVLRKYDDSLKQYVKPYFKEKEYVFENYLVNEYFKELMPFGKFNNIWDSYVYLCVIYGIIKLHLIGMAGLEHGVDEDKVVQLIQSFSKVALHNNHYVQGLIKLLRDNGYDSLAYMAILVKN